MTTRTPAVLKIVSGARLKLSTVCFFIYADAALTLSGSPVVHLGGGLGPTLPQMRPPPAPPTWAAQARDLCCRPAHLPTSPIPRPKLIRATSREGRGTAGVGVTEPRRRRSAVPAVLLHTAWSEGDITVEENTRWEFFEIAAHWRSTTSRRKSSCKAETEQVERNITGLKRGKHFVECENTH